jgi:large subunit ribosomal protein L15
MKLNELKPNPGSNKRKMIVGRGIGSGKGKTCGRGVKGQKARTGVSLHGFEGGQMPLYRRLPKQGFTNIFALDYITVTLGKLQEAVDSKKLAPGAIDEDALVKAGVVRRKRDGVRIVSGGTLKAGLKLKVRGGVTKTAQAAIEKAGGSVEVVKPAPAPVVKGQGKAKDKAKKKA